MSKTLIRLFGGAALGAAAMAAYIRIVRPWHLRWGANVEELDRSLPGDELVSNPKQTSTRAIRARA